MIKLEKPIILSSELVKSILTNNKTQTRFVIKKKYGNTDIEWFTNKYGTRLVEMQNDAKPNQLCGCIEINTPYKKGDILWVCEPWGVGSNCGNYHCRYKADGIEYPNEKWIPPTYMPRSMARMFLQVKSIRAERLQDISEKNAKNEGAGEVLLYRPYKTKLRGNKIHLGDNVMNKPNYITGFAELWDRLCKKEQYSWASNPWVWVIEFNNISKPTLLTGWGD